MQTLFARKKGMTGKFDEAGNRVGATQMEIMPMTVDSSRNLEKHGYKAIRLKVQDAKAKNKLRYREVRTDAKMEDGAEIKLEEILKAGDKVKVTGVSKGKGFAGAVKRYGFKGGPRTHGQSDRERAPGSSGSTTTPGRVYKGKRRAGHMGVITVTTVGLKVLEVDPEKKTVVLVGAVPGAKNGLVKITKI